MATFGGVVDGAIGQAGPAEFGLLGDFFMEAEPTVAVETHAIALFDRGTPVTIPADGHPIPYRWAAVPGATGAEVSAAGLRITSSTTQRPLGDLKTAADGSRYVVTTGGKRIYSLKLNGLKYLPEGAEDEVAIGSTGEIPGGFHLVVEIPNPAGGWLPPLHAVPPAPRQGMIPETLTGASFQDGVLRLPDVVASKIRLTFARGDTANEFEEQGFTLGTVEGTETVVPKDLRVVGPDDAVAWAFPGDFPPTAPSAEVDLRLPLQTALTAAVKAGQPPEATFRIEGSGTISLVIHSTHGALLREAAGLVRTVLAGDDVTLGDDSTLPAEVPSSASADLTVRYDGIRLLETVSDPIPAPVGPSVGLVVTVAGAIRELPPTALEGRVVRRIGLFGRAPVEAQIEVGLVDAVSGSALTPSGPLTVAASAGFATHWIELPPHDPIARPANLSVRASSGRFLWVATDHPLAKIAIDDPAWTGRAVSLGGFPLAVPSGVPESQQPGATLPTAAFAGRSPRLHSDLFLTIDVGDLVLRYAR